MPRARRQHVGLGHVWVKSWPCHFGLGNFQRRVAHQETKHLLPRAGLESTFGDRDSRPAHEDRKCIFAFLVALFFLSNFSFGTSQYSARLDAREVFTMCHGKHVSGCKWRYAVLSAILRFSPAPIATLASAPAISPAPAADNTPSAATARRSAPYRAAPTYAGAARAQSRHTDPTPLPRHTFPRACTRV